MSEAEAEETMETEEVESGEVASMEVSVDKEVNVLDDILNSDTGQDAFQKELDNASNKTAAKGKKGKSSKVVAPKRKSTRKSKVTPAKATKAETITDTKTEVKKLEVKNTKSEVKTTEKTEIKGSKQEAKAAKNDSTKETSQTSAKANGSEKSPNQSKPKTENTTTEKKTSPKPTETKKSSKTVSLTALPTKLQDDTNEAAVPLVSASPAIDKIQKSKVVKKTKSATATMTTVSSASKKSMETKPKESKIPETLTPDESLLQQEILVKKVKDLEKLVAQTDAIEKEQKSKEEKTSSSEKKRLSSSSSSKYKSKSSTKEKKSEAVAKDVVVKSEVFSDGEDKKMDTRPPRSRSRSFSRSYSGSFTGSFSGSLSSFTGSNFSDLDSPRLSHHGSPSTDNKSRKSKEDDEDVAAHKTFVESLLKGARYFIIKSNNHENVALSKAKGVWATPPANERKLNDAFKHSTNVILIFSVKESGRFQGFARLSSLSQHNLPPVPWVLPPGFDRNVLRGTFKVDWLNRLEVQFAQCSNLRNPWNENKEVKICRDGQEVEPSVGERLCSMFEVDHTVDLPRIAHHLKQNKPGGSGGGHHRGASAGPSRYSGPRGGGRGWRGRDRGRRGVGYNRRYSPKRGNGGGDRYEGRRGYYGGGGGDCRRRSRSRSYEHRRDSRRHRDKVKEFLKNDRSRFGVAKETLLNGSYSDYVREFQRQKQIQYTDPTRTAAEEFLRATHRR